LILHIFEIALLAQLLLEQVDILHWECQHIGHKLANQLIRLKYATSQGRIFIMLEARNNSGNQWSRDSSLSPKIGGGGLK
jgi:hypothetical protein